MNMQNHSVLCLQLRTQRAAKPSGILADPKIQSPQALKASKSTRTARARFLERGVRERINVGRRLVQEHHAGLAKIRGGGGVERLSRLHSSSKASSTFMR